MVMPILAIFTYILRIATFNLGDVEVCAGLEVKDANAVKVLDPVVTKHTFLIEKSSAKVEIEVIQKI
ncbi:unnamed protein product [Dibothriocephalus latus]|uniref:Uncharacterized protein n=1 Tax=Dibothriocephalus latus TaxID=60516 RepID=A0A3P7NZH4_DIBLA|nr:unnamed protein product [Dibothriocephalus latus]